MGEVMRRSGQDPNFAGVASRDYLVRSNEKQIDVLNKFATAAANEGNMGPQAMMAKVEMLNDFANNPWMRFGTRAMQAMDGFTQAVIGSMEAKGRAFDALQAGRITEDKLKATARVAYDDMFVDGVIRDDQVRKASGELTFSLDNKTTDAVNQFMNRYPGLRPFFLFTKTPVNMLKYFGSHNPAGLFFDQVNKFKRPFEEMPIEKVRELLTAKGVSTTNPESMAIAYNQIRAELKGRKAMGALAVTGAVTLFMNDNITGNGNFDKQQQRLRRDANWQPKSIRIPGGQWVSYESLGAVGDWLALTADVMDNFGNMEEYDIATSLNAMGFILSSSVTDKTMLSSMEPLFDILSGNPAAINRWAGGFAASMVPGSGQLNELNKLITPQLKVVDDNVFAQFANRTPLKAGLPDQYDWIDGGLVNEPGNFLSRVFNAYSPFKVNGNISKEKQFLIDIEFDNRPSMMSDGQGVSLTPEEQSALYNYIGKNGLFKKEVQRIMQTTDGKAFRQAFEAAQKSGKPVSVADFQNIHIMLDRAMNSAKTYAIAQVDAANGGAISERRHQAQSNRYLSRTNQIDQILSIPK